MIIDCDTCTVRGIACGDCVIGVLLPSPTFGEPVSDDSAEERWSPVDLPSGAPYVQFDAIERRALAALAAQGLIPRLRLVVDHPRRVSEAFDAPETERDAG